MIIPWNSTPVSNNLWPKDILNLEELVFNSALRISLPWAWWKASQLSAPQHPAEGICLSLKLKFKLKLCRYFQDESKSIATKLLAWKFFICVTARMIKLWHCNVCSDHLPSNEDAVRLTSSEDLLQFIWLSWALKAYLCENSGVSKGVFTTP